VDHDMNDAFGVFFVVAKLLNINFARGNKPNYSDKFTFTMACSYNVHLTFDCVQETWSHIVLQMNDLTRINSSILCTVIEYDIYCYEFCVTNEYT